MNAKFDFHLATKVEVAQQNGLEKF